MSSRDEKSQVWTGIISTVVGGLILAAVYALWPAVREWINGVFKYIGSALVSAWSYLLSSIEIPWLLFWLLILLAIPTLWKIVSPIVNKIRKIPAEQTEPNLKEYVEDRFLNLIWRWKFTKNGFPDTSLWCFCPECNTRVVVVYRHGRAGALGTSLFCETCGEEKFFVDGKDRDDIKGMISRQIERRINTGEWKDVVMILRKTKPEPPQEAL